MNLEDYIGEATSYDKKLMLERKDPTSWLKSVSAFANTQGGKLLFGVANDGALCGLAGALIHRDYLEIGSEVHIDIYDDRMEIVSPGGMPSGKRVQELDLRQVSSMRRNPVIADLFQRLDLMERRGSGFKKILESYAFESEKRGIAIRPSFHSSQTDFFAVLPDLNYGRTIDQMAGQVTGYVTGQVTGPVEGHATGLDERIPVNVTRLLRVMKTELGIHEIMAKIRLSSRAQIGRASCRERV